MFLLIVCRWLPDLIAFFMIVSSNVLNQSYIKPLGFGELRPLDM